MRCCCCVLGRHLLYIYILIACLVACLVFVAKCLKTWPVKITVNFSRTRLNKGFYQPENQEKRALEEGKGARAREKKTSR